MKEYVKIEVHSNFTLDKLQIINFSSIYMSTNLGVQGFYFIYFNLPPLKLKYIIFIYATFTLCIGNLLFLTKTNAIFSLEMSKIKEIVQMLLNMVILYYFIRYYLVQGF